MNARIRRTGALAVALAAALASGAFFAAGAATAGPIADSASQAEQLLAAGNAADALAAFDTATDAFWQASPLQFRKMLFADAVSGYGRYTAHQGTTFKAGDTAVIYFEPVGYGFGQDGDNIRIAFSTGVEIRTPGGLILAGTADLADLTWTGTAKTREFYGALSLALPALKAGSYQLILTVTDAVSGKSAKTTLPFVIGS
jgi:hypothetical protein